MPLNDSSAAAALALSTSSSPSPSPSPSRLSSSSPEPGFQPEPAPTSPNHQFPSSTDRLPPWARPGPSPESGDDLFPSLRQPGARRLSMPYSRGRAGSEQRQPLGQRLLRSGVAVSNRLLKLGYSMTPLQRALAGAGGLAVLTLVVVFLVFSHRIFAALHPVAESWREIPGGWVILFLLSAFTAFPPMIGYSTTVTIAGFVFGFPAGWPIIAGATVAGSTASFLASRTVFSAYVHRLVGEDRRFVALGQVLRHDGLPVLVAIRFCPLPFSLSNGFLATIPSISPGAFALATALSTPKLLIHVFIGDRLAQLADSDDMPASTRVINYLGILFGVVVGITVGWLVYQRTMRRVKELALEEAVATENGVLLADEFEYNDVEEGVLGPAQTRRSGESDAAALMDDDDISLWDTTESNHGAYRDEEDTTGPNKVNSQDAK
ncbi:hypothetical protein F5Y14DRAFT_178265 [Nemania sp. NC0429]|nr:hypothetical protein F5Y14DRAFT_178265 [Nemania sp. NC0429]